MVANITIEVVKDGNIEQCRELCNELMALQRSKAVMFKESFDMMNFDTRMKSSFDSTPHSHVVVAKINGTPEGYIFSTIEDVKTGDKSGFPDWAPAEVKERAKTEKIHLFYPEWDNLPEKCGCLNHLYLREAVRGEGLGVKMCDMAMEWLRSFPVDMVFVYVSNGNKAALDFYLKYGFKHSHEVLGGFIQAAYLKI